MIPVCDIKLRNQQNNDIYYTECVPIFSLVDRERVHIFPSFVIHLTHSYSPSRYELVCFTVNSFYSELDYNKLSIITHSFQCPDPFFCFNIMCLYWEVRL